MAPIQVYDRDDVIELLASQASDTDDFAQRAIELIDQWVERGDGCAVYRNEEIGSPMMGMLKFVSFGSQKSQLPVTAGGPPPIKLPDIGGDINWRYLLVGMYRPVAAAGGNGAVVELTRDHPSTPGWKPKP